MQKKKVELLAPAGNKEAFYGAIHAGADAIYLGGSRFGARAYADNFTEEELISCIRYAHIFGRKVYLTVNTLVKESEFSELYEYLSPFYETGLDGVIVQDIGVFTYIREQFPGMELHVSTQMTITGPYGAQLIKEMGACRVVPARELSLQEISAMKEATGMEIECFIHGAMCYCYSGQCLFSSILGGRSGNRGRCAQPCRLPYTVKGIKGTTKECYPLSLKDMCTIEMIPALIEAGIDSFKIEGRMKKPEYAAGVTAIYRKYIDRYYASPQKEFKVSGADLEKLSRLYIRSERQNGYYYKHNGKDMVTLESPAYSGSDEVLLAEIRSRYLETSPKVSVSVYGYFQVGEPATVTYIADTHSVTVTGELVQNASKQPISQDNIEKQLGKLGGSVFEIESMDITLSEQAFYSLKALNELRRAAIRQLEDAIIDAHGLIIERAIPVQTVLSPKKADSSEKSRQSSNVGAKKQFHVSIQTVEQWNALQKAPYFREISRIDINGDCFVESEGQQKKLLTELKTVLLAGNAGNTPEFIIALPTVLRMQDEVYLEKLLLLAREYCDIIKGFRISSMEAFGYLKKKQYSGKIYADAGFYIWNLNTLHTWEQDMEGYCMPWELKSPEQRNIMQDKISCEKIFYGRIPMMVTANCVAKTTEGCLKGTKKPDVILIDRYQKQFPVVRNCLHCMNTIYNSVPLSLHNEWDKWKSLVDMRLDFTIEREKEVLEILDYFYEIYQNGLTSGKQPPFGEYTTGHEKRGVE